MNPYKKITCEFVGTGFLLVSIVGSGIMGERLSGGSVALALLCNSIATGGALLALILTFGPFSGAHFNPVVTISEAIKGNISSTFLPGYLAAQFFGALAGVLGTNVMFGLPTFTASTHARSGLPQFVSEVVATFGLLTIIHFTAMFGPKVVAPAIAAYITGAYWFLPSTSFANPAVTLARAMTNTFSGIRPADIFGFCVAQILGAALATGFSVWIHSNAEEHALRQHVGFDSVKETHE